MTDNPYPVVRMISGFFFLFLEKRHFNQHKKKTKLVNNPYTVVRMISGFFLFLEKRHFNQHKKKNKVGE